MATLLRTEVPAILQAAEHAQYKGAYCPPGVPFKEARRGPHDGTRIAVRREANGDLPKHLVMTAGRIVYELDTYLNGEATYRYAPRLSPAHVGIMDGVAEVYAQRAGAGR